MTYKIFAIVFIALLGACTAQTLAQKPAHNPAPKPAQSVIQTGPFHAGPAISQFGKIAAVQSDLPIPADTDFNIVFDMGEQAAPGTVNRTITSAARFINMHVAAGVPAENIHIAIVAHGGASFDVTNQARYSRKNEQQTNSSAAAISELLRHQVEFYLCGQSAAAHGIDHDDLLPGVKMALSAMTAHALLLQSGYTANPF